MFTYSEMQNGKVLIKSWLFSKSNELDIEIWIDGRHVKSATVELGSES